MRVPEDLTFRFMSLKHPVFSEFFTFYQAAMCGMGWWKYSIDWTNHVTSLHLVFLTLHPNV